MTTIAIPLHLYTVNAVLKAEAALPVLRVIAPALRHRQAVALDFAQVRFVDNDFIIHALGALYWEFAEVDELADSIEQKRSRQRRTFLEQHLLLKNVKGLYHPDHIATLLYGCRTEILAILDESQHFASWELDAHHEIAPGTWGAWRTSGNKHRRILKILA